MHEEPEKVIKRKTTKVSFNEHENQRKWSKKGMVKQLLADGQVYPDLSSERDY